MSVRPRASYELFMLGLCIYAVGALIVSTVFTLPEHAARILYLLDGGIAVLFLIDFGVQLARAPNRLRYLYTWGWIDLLSSIPAVMALRWGRAARAFRIVRILRQMRALGKLDLFTRQHLPQSAFLGTVLIILLLLVICSISIVGIERGVGNIDSAEEALWWSLVTTTTVGYGDYYPVTLAGRILAMILMVAGVGLFGTFTSLVASRFLGSGNDDTAAELRLIRGQLDELRKALRERDSGPTPGGG